MVNELTQIKLKKTTVKRLKKLGSKGETYDEIVNKLIGENKNG